MTTRPFLPFGATDRSMAVMDTVSSVTFHVVVDIAGDIDRRRLQTAWARLANRHPVLAGRVDVAHDRSWDVGTRELPAALFYQAADQRESAALVDRALRRQCNAMTGPVALLTVISIPGSAKIVLSAHHAAIDGRAAFLVLDDLRIMYVSDVALPAESEVRTADAALTSSGLSLVTRERVVARSRRRWRRLRASRHSDPAPAVPKVPALRYATMDLGSALETLAAARRRSGWHIDAVLVGLLAAAWADVFGDRGVSGWLLAADFRTELGLTRGIGNLSGAEPVAVSDADAPLTDVIDQAQTEVAALRSSYPGLAPEFLAGAFSVAPIPVLNRGVQWAWDRARALRYTRIVSNLGVLDAGLRDWGTASLDDVAFVPPLAHPPYSVFMVSTFGGATTVTVRTSQHWLTVRHVERLEAAVVKSLQSLVAVNPRSGRAPSTPTELPAT